MKLLALIKYNTIKFLRDKTAWMFALLLPVIFTAVIGLAYGSVNEQDLRIPVGVANKDKDKVTQALLEEFKKDKSIAVREMTEEELLDEVKNANVEAGFIIPAGFGSRVRHGVTGEMEVVRVPSSVDYMAIEGIMTAALARLRVREGMIEYFTGKLDGMDNKTASNALKDIGEKIDENLAGRPLLTMKATRYSGKNEVSYDGKAQSSIGMAVMFVMFTLILGAGEILEEKKNNTWGRLVITPTSRTTLITGKILGTYLIGWVQIMTLILFGSLVLGVSWGDSLPASMAVMGLYLLAVTALGMFLSSLVKTNAQLGAISAVFIICTSMLSGCYWPVDIMPQSMQAAASFFPQYWAMKALTGTVVANLGIRSVLMPMGVLSLMALLFFVLSVIKGRFKFDIRHKASQSPDGQVAD